MKPVDQTLFGPDDGNCLQAAIASVLELELEQVPDFANEYDEPEWHDRLNEWLVRWYGMWLVFVANDGQTKPPGYHLIGSDRIMEAMGAPAHVVVGFNGEQVHDPYPAGGWMSQETYGLFVTMLNSRRGRRPVQPLPRRGIL